MVNCARCSHPLSKHCKGEQQHSDYKEESRLIDVEYRTKTFICHVRHCLNALCSCVDFIEPDSELARILAAKTAEVEAQVAEWKYRTPKEIQAMTVVFPPEVRETPAENAAWLNAIARDDRRDEKKEAQTSLFE
jgi:hypothetical protein